MTQQLNTPSGDNQVLSVDRTARSITYLHRADAAPSVLRLDLFSGNNTILYKSNNQLTYKSTEEWVSSEDGYRIPLYIWRADGATSRRGAIIRLHAFNVKEDGLWQDEVQLAVSNGLDYIGCNFRGSLGFGFDLERQGTSENQVKDVHAAIDYVHNTLGVPLNKIALLGYSAGADLALQSAVDSTQPVGVLALVGSSARQIRACKWHTSSHPHTLLFHGRYESVSFSQIVDSGRRLGKMCGSEDAVDAYEIDDNHDFNYPTSKSEIYSAIMGELGAIN
jgi:pimeloyl-ACP methyl ester carboxylesterase